MKSANVNIDRIIRISRLQVEISRLKRERDEESKSYVADVPKLRELTKQIEALEKELKALKGDEHV